MNAADEGKAVAEVQLLFSLLNKHSWNSAVKTHISSCQMNIAETKITVMAFQKQLHIIKITNLYRYSLSGQFLKNS